MHGLLYPVPEMAASGWTWGILGVSFAVDGFVLHKALSDVRQRAADAKVGKPNIRKSSPRFSFPPPPLAPLQMSVASWILAFKDPFTVAVVFEDGAAVAGVGIAAAGIGMQFLTGSHIWDSLASIAIGGMLAGVSLKLILMNRNFIYGKPLDPEIAGGIRSILLKRPSIDAVFSEQSQWIGPSAFSYKAEVDVDGTYLASKVISFFFFFFFFHNRVPHYLTPLP